MVIIDEPIFILGGGRSGTTILYELVSLHPDVCWFSNLTDLTPDRPGVALFHRVLDVPGLGDRLKRRILTKKRPTLRPSEAGRIYARCGFDDTRKMTAEDVGHVDFERFAWTIERHLKSTGKRRFLNKQTGNNQRLTLINALFPRAAYIHIIRDGRAVANSFSRVPWWDDLTIWWSGETPRAWEAAGRPRLELCALHWKMELMEILDHKTMLDRYFEVRYEDLVRDTQGILRSICDFAGLEWSSKFQRLIPNNLPAMNFKWKEKLSADEQEVVVKAVGDALQSLGYLTP